jgi:hypothetical protein
MNICKLCGKNFEDEKAFHIHVSKQEKMRLVEYYQKFYPRHDLLTGEIIKYKSKEYYFSTSFNSRKNLLDYCLKNQSTSREIVKDQIARRHKLKNYTKPPSTVECRTSILPSPALLKRLNFDYNEVCNEVGIKSFFDYKQELKFDGGEEFIMIDTREQNPLDLECKTLVTKLDFGDYTSRSHYKKIHVERKSLTDLCGTMSAGFERFKKEVERCKEMGAYLVVVVEESLDVFNVFNTLPKMKHLKSTPEFISSRIKKLIYEYDCLQFLFVKNREEMKKTVKNIFLLNNDINKIDLQYYYDCGLLTQK